MLFEDTYLTVENPAEGLFKDKGSRFLAFAYPVTSEEQIRERLSVLKKQHPSANHHCYAFRLGADKLVFRANDNCEPANTAGKPILGQIQSKDLTNILIYKENEKKNPDVYYQINTFDIISKSTK